MMIRFEPSTDFPSEKELQLVGKALDFVFPRDFVDFVCSGKAGKPEPHGFQVKEGHEGDFQDFFAARDIIRMYVIAAHLLEPDFVPIAYDAGGNYVCFKKRAPNAGAVFFIDHDLHGAPGQSMIASILGETQT
jgi:SMI1-KNR4 cell-wall